ncbi:MAG: hypothetical protein ACI8S2_001450, partial [Bacteroidia bacterium]
QDPIVKNDGQTFPISSEGISKSILSFNTRQI